MIAAFALILLIMAGIIVISILLGPPTARYLGQRAGRLYFPDEKFSEPQPMYGIPESKRAAGLHEEAIAGYEEIAQDYPSELRPYIEMIDISLTELRDSNRADEIYQHGISLLEREDDRKHLANAYRAIRGD